MLNYNQLFIFFILMYNVHVVLPMKDSSDDFVDDSQWTIVYSPRSQERRNQQEEMSPRTSSSKNSVNLQDYDPASAHVSGEIGESSVDDRIISDRFEQEPMRPPIQVTIIKNQEAQTTNYKSIKLVAGVTLVGFTGFAFGWFSHYMNSK